MIGRELWRRDVSKKKTHASKASTLAVRYHRHHQQHIPWRCSAYFYDNIKTEQGKRGGGVNIHVRFCTTIVKRL